MPYKRIHIFYSGRVQGVGFRYTVRSIASELDLSGWTRNLRDGNVEVVCEGDEKKLKAFLDNIKKEFPEHYIRDVEVTWEEPTGEFNAFEIRF